MDHYENDFEAAMLKDTAAYYSRKASNWILEDSCPDYMQKVASIICSTFWKNANILSTIQYQITTDTLWEILGRGMSKKGKRKSFSLPAL